jgi:glucose/arabinose dehydrogenase
MTPDPADDTPSHPRSRRRFLALTGAAVVAAGCATDASEQTPTPAPTSDGSSDADGDADGTGGDADGSDGTADSNSAVGRPVEDWPRYDPDWTAPATSPLASELTVEVLVENLEIPWDMSFAPDGALFLTERVGRVLEFDGGEVQAVASPADAIDAGSMEPGADEQPWWIEGGEGGTLGIAVHPEFPDPSEVFVYYTTSDDETESGVTNRVNAFDVRSDDPGIPVRTVVDDIPADNFHNGGRLEFGPRNYLWVTCGDGLSPERAQDRSSLGGKIIRVTPEGEPAPDNPGLGADADPRVFTYGHRNPQGVVWLPDGTPVASEHGPSGRDEINRLVAGDDYGWDVEDERVRRRGQYPGSDVHRPLYNTAGTSFAPTGSLFYTGDSVPALRNRMLTGGLISQQLVVTTLTPPGAEMPPAGDAYEQVDGADWSDDAYAATVHTLLENELGRIRHVEQGPGGDIYVCTSNRDGRATEGFPTERDDVLARIRPA